MVTSQAGLQPSSAQGNPVFRSPRRITITLPYGAYQRLRERSELEGRSLSNLAAYLLEHAMSDPMMDGITKI